MDNRLVLTPEAAEELFTEGCYDGLEQVERVLDEERRWGNDYRIVFSKDDGTFWSGVCYEPGEGGEYEYPDTLTQVWPHEVTKIEYTTTPNGREVNG